MTVQQVIGLALRLVALLFGITALFNLVLVLGASSSGDSSVLQVVSELMYLVMAVLLWMFPMSLAHRLLPKTSHTDKIITNSNQLAVAGVALLGLWLLVGALPNLFGQVVVALKYSNDGSIFDALTHEGMDNRFIMILFELAMTCVLLFKAHRIARFLTA